MGFDYFDKIYCIHLPNKERHKNIKKEFEKMGMTERVTYIHATPPPRGFSMTNMRRAPRGEFGVNLSQIKAVVHAINDKAVAPLFLEDDVVFRENASELLERAFLEIPKDWDVLYMGGHPRGKNIGKPATRYSKTLARVHRHSFADAYCIKGENLIEFFDVWCNRISQQNAMYDIILGDWIESKHAYCVIPVPCTQRTAVSQISGKQEDKVSLINRGWVDHLGETL